MLAITDHDTTAGVPAALEAARQYGITLVPGVEISTLSGREEIHLLGYFVDLDDANLQELLVHTRERRRERAEQMLVRLAQLGLPLELDRVLAHAGQAPGASVGRAHVAMALLEAGHVNSFEEAFNLWIGRDRPAYVERFKISPEDAIELVRKSGGIPVLAHPYTFTRSGEFKTGLDLKRWLPRLLAAGLMGIEVYYPRYPHRITRRLLMLAIHYGLLITGGSDSHGAIAAGDHTDSGLGSIAVPYIVWEGLERRHNCQGHCNSASTSQSLGGAEPGHHMRGRWRSHADSIACSRADHGDPDGLQTEQPDCWGQSSFASSQV